MTLLISTGHTPAYGEVLPAPAGSADALLRAAWLREEAWLALSDAERVTRLDWARRDAARDRKRGYVVREAELLGARRYTDAMIAAYRAAGGMVSRYR